MDVRAALNHLLASPLFTRFEAALKQDSIFDVLNVGTREVSHAAFLRWLLDPQEGHGAGDHPLRSFLMRAAAKAKDPETLTPLDVDLCDLDTAAAVCEFQVESGGTKGRLDILVTLEGHEGNRDPLLIVEHKVYADQSGNQTKLYADWAGQNRFTVEGNGRELAIKLPLLVYVCPEFAKQSAPPGKPFVVFEYDDLSAWLDDVLAGSGVSDRGNFLIREYRACLAGQDLFDNPKARECMDLMLADEQCARAVTILRAHPQELRSFDPHVARHHKAFAKLSIEHARVGSKGDAATVVRFRELCENVFADDKWGMGGRTGSVSIWCGDVAKLAREAVGADAVKRVGSPYIQFYLSRPEREAGVLDLYGGIVGGDREARKPMQKLISEACEALRGLVPTELKSERVRGNAMARFKLTFPGIATTADDRFEAVQSHEQELQRAAETARALKPIVERYVGESLPNLLERYFPGGTGK